MSRLRALLAGGILVAQGVAAGCKTNEEAQPLKPAEAQAEAKEHGSGSADEHVVRVDKSMLRDLRVTTQPAESRPAGDVVTVLGELRVDEERYAEIGSSITARVAKILVAPGDVVTKGQALVELDSPEVGRARAAVTTTQARRDLARQTVERRRGLAADQIVPQREMQAAEADLSQAEAEYRAAGQALTALGATSGQGARFTLSSPIAGTVIARTALLGRLVDAERPLLVVGELSHLWLIGHAYERDALRMHAGTTARVNFPALPARAVSGNVTRIASQVDPISRTIDVRIEIDNADGLLRPGMSATALVPVGDSTENVVTVPVEAVQRRRDGWCVFLPRDEEGSFEILQVGRGRDLGGEVEILSGLRPGQRVVVEGAFLLRAEAEKAGGDDEHHH